MHFHWADAKRIVTMIVNVRYVDIIFYTFLYAPMLLYDIYSSLLTQTYVSLYPTLQHHPLGRLDMLSKGWYRSHPRLFRYRNFR